MIGGGERALRIPPGMKLSDAPSCKAVDAQQAASNKLLNATIVMKFEHYGWCTGTIVEKVTDQRRRFRGEQVTFVAKFDIDSGTTDLCLDDEDYDPSLSAEYGAWLLIEPEPERGMTAERCTCRGAHACMGGECVRLHSGRM